MRKTASKIVVNDCNLISCLYTHTHTHTHTHIYIYIYIYISPDDDPVRLETC